MKCASKLNTRVSTMCAYKIPKYEKFSRAISRNIAGKHIRRSKTARKPKYRHIKSKTKLAFVIISYSTKNCCELWFSGETLAHRNGLKEKNFTKKKWWRTGWATHKRVEFLKSKISTSPSPCKHCVQMKNATMLFCMMINTAKQWNYSTVKNSQKIPKPWYYVFGLMGPVFILHK